MHYSAKYRLLRPPRGHFLSCKVQLCAERPATNCEIEFGEARCASEGLQKKNNRI